MFKNQLDIIQTNLLNFNYLQKNNFKFKTKIKSVKFEQLDNFSNSFDSYLFIDIGNSINKEGNEEVKENVNVQYIIIKVYSKDNYSEGDCVRSSQAY